MQCILAITYVTIWANIYVTDSRIPIFTPAKSYETLQCFGLDASLQYYWRAKSNYLLIPDFLTNTAFPTCTGSMSKLLSVKTVSLCLLSVHHGLMQWMFKAPQLRTWREGKGSITPVTNTFPLLPCWPLFGDFGHAGTEMSF